MTLIPKQDFFKNGWNCSKCGKMTEHRKEGSGASAKLICTVCRT